MMTWTQVIASLLTLAGIFVTAFFWLWTRLEAKRTEDKASFIAIFERLRILDSRVAYLFGARGEKIEDIPTSRLV